MKKRFFGKFLFYKINNERIQELNVGSAVPSLTIQVLNDIKIKIPKNTKEQKAIADVLSSFDNKIELLREQNETLESLGKVLFKKMFIKNPNRKNWSVGKITKITERLIIKYKCEKKDLYYTGKIPIIDQGENGIYGYTKRNPDFKATKDNPVILFTNHTCNFWFIDHPFCAIQNVIPFRGVNGYDEYFIYFLVKDSIKFKEYKGHWPEFEAKKFAIPSVAEANKFSNVAKPILQKINQNKSQIQTLEKMRDMLLPKLMSGDLRVKC